MILAEFQYKGFSFLWREKMNQQILNKAEFLKRKIADAEQSLFKTEQFLRIFKEHPDNIDVEVSVVINSYYKSKEDARLTITNETNKNLIIGIFERSKECARIELVKLQKEYDML